MRRVTGIGGVFFKAKDPESLYDWYEKHLGIKRDPIEGVTFPWREAQNPSKEGMTVWSIFSKDTTYFDPSTSDFMINYRVEDLDKLLAALQKEGVSILGKEDSEYGCFAWILDPEGRRIELWQPPVPSALGPDKK